MKLARRCKDRLNLSNCADFRGRRRVWPHLGDTTGASFLTSLHLKTISSEPRNRKMHNMCSNSVSAWQPTDFGGRRDEHARRARRMITAATTVGTTEANMPAGPMIRDRSPAWRPAPGHEPARSAVNTASMASSCRAPPLPPTHPNAPGCYRIRPAVKHSARYTRSTCPTGKSAPAWIRT